jgi:hypothetical protein
VPSEVKAAVTGNGGAGKAQATAMVTRILGLQAKPTPADAADALALAIFTAGGHRSADVTHWCPVPVGRQPSWPWPQRSSRDSSFPCRYVPFSSRSDVLSRKQIDRFIYKRAGDTEETGGPVGHRMTVDRAANVGLGRL